MVFDRLRTRQYAPGARSRWLLLGSGILTTAASPVSGALVMYLKMDDPANSATLADSSGNGYNNNVIVNGGTTNGDYLSLNAASLQSVTLDSTAIPAFTSSASYTVTACLRPQSTPAWSRFFDFNSEIRSGSNPCSPTVVSLWNCPLNYAGQGQVGFELYPNCGLPISASGSTATALSNTMWTQVTMASDGNYVYLYAGTTPSRFAISPALQPPNYSPPIQNLLLGRAWSNDAGWYTGDMKDFRFLTENVTEATLQQWADDCNANNPPTDSPTFQPTKVPTLVPSQRPTGTPTEQPSGQPTTSPTSAPTVQPTAAPTSAPTVVGASDDWSPVAEAGMGCPDGTIVPLGSSGRRGLAQEDGAAARELAGGGSSTNPTVQACAETCQAYFAPNNAQIYFNLIELGGVKTCECCLTCEPLVQIPGAQAFANCIAPQNLAVKSKLFKAKAKPGKLVFVTATMCNTLTRNKGGPTAPMTLEGLALEIAGPAPYVRVVDTAVSKPKRARVNASAVAWSTFSLRPGKKRRLSAAFRVDTTAPLGTELVFQATVYQTTVANAPYCPLTAPPAVAKVVKPKHA